MTMKPMPPVHPAAAIFPLMPEAELQALADHIKIHGLQHKIVIRLGLLLDGRNRWLACGRAGVVPETVTRDDIKDPISFVIGENLRHRHLTPSQASMLGGQLSEMFEADARGRMALGGRAAGGDVQALANLQSAPGVRSNERAAALVGSSPRSVGSARVVLKSKVPALAAAVTSGAVAVSAAAEVATLPKEEIEEIVARGPKEITAKAKEIAAEKRTARRTEKTEKLAAIAKGNGPLHTATKYPVIYADPSWKYDSGTTDPSRTIDNQYPPMPLEEIKALPVGELATGAAVLFMWATNPMLPEALEVGAAWGFEYRSNWAWDKEIAGAGYWGRGQHELLLIFVRGDMPTAPESTRPPSVIRSRRGEHSAKPTEAAERIERMYPTLPKIELFARNVRPGWVGWGNQAKPAAPVQEPLPIEGAPTATAAPTTREEPAAAPAPVEATATATATARPTSAIVHPDAAPLSVEPDTGDEVDDEGIRYDALCVCGHTNGGHGGQCLHPTGERATWEAHPDRCECPRFRPAAVSDELIERVAALWTEEIAPGSPADNQGRIAVRGILSGDEEEIETWTDEAVEFIRAAAVTEQAAIDERDNACFDCHAKPGQLHQGCDDDGRRIPVEDAPRVCRVPTAAEQADFLEEHPEYSEALPARPKAKAKAKTSKPPRVPVDAVTQDIGAPPDARRCTSVRIKGVAVGTRCFLLRDHRDQPIHMGGGGAWTDEDGRRPVTATSPTTFDGACNECGQHVGDDHVEWCDGTKGAWLVSRRGELRPDGTSIVRRQDITDEPAVKAAYEPANVPTEPRAKGRGKAPRATLASLTDVSHGALDVDPRAPAPPPTKPAKGKVCGECKVRPGKIHGPECSRYPLTVPLLEGDRETGEKMISMGRGEGKQGQRGICFVAGRGLVERGEFDAARAWLGKLEFFGDEARARELRTLLQTEEERRAATRRAADAVAPVAAPELPLVTLTNSKRANTLIKHAQSAMKAGNFESARDAIDELEELYDTGKTSEATRANAASLRVHLAAAEKEAAPIPKPSAIRVTDPQFIAAIEAAYSADTIAAKGIVRAPFALEGRLWISLGGESIGNGKNKSERVEAWRLTPIVHWTGPSFTVAELHDSWDSDEKKRGDSTGLRVLLKVKGKSATAPYVLDGERRSYAWGPEEL